MRKQNGFTLIEIAIVLVIIGLLLGGVLKGQELITSARVRNLISQQDGIKAAFFGFQDRYRAYPGDYDKATTNVPGATKNGNGNSRIEADNGTDKESILVWEHLSKSGFINGAYTYAASLTADSNAKNPYAAYLQLVYDGVYGTGTTGTPLTAKHNLKTGTQVPVEIIAEVDRKVDDGYPYQGAFQFSLFDSGATAPTAAGCINTTPTPNAWKVDSGDPNCGGASLF